MNHCYELKNFNVTNESVAFPSGSGNTLQISLIKHSEICELEDEDGKFPGVPLNFIDLTALNEVPDKVQFGWN